MGANNHPPEIAELIIHFASDPVPDVFVQIPGGDPGHKRILLSCALVCKAWLWPARRRLLDLNPRLGTVKVSPQTLTTTFDILLSPLCTLDLGFIHLLEIAVNPKSKVGAAETLSFSNLVSTIEKIPLLSLRTLNFRNVSLSFNIDEGENSSYGSPAPTTLPQIKVLTFEYPNNNPLAFENVIHATRFFPFLETLTAHATTGGQHRSKVVYSLRPPQSLRRLCADTPTILRMIEWLTAYKPHHTNISALSIYGPTRDHEEEEVAERVSLALSVLGPSLKEFELILLSQRYLHEHVFSFVNNPSLKKIQIRGKLLLLARFLPLLSRVVHSVPRLEELEFYANPWKVEQYPSMGEFIIMDAIIQSYRSLRKVNFTRELTSGFEDPYDFQHHMMKLMPRCTERHMVGFTERVYLG